MDIRPIGNMAQSAPTEKSINGAQSVVAAKAVAAPVEGVAPAAVQQPAPVPSLGQLAQAVQSINKMLQEKDQSVEFSVDSDSNQTIVKVVDQKTKEVLRQMPSQQVLEIAKALDLGQHGLLIKQKA